MNSSSWLLNNSGNKNRHILTICYCLFVYGWSVFNRVRDGPLEKSKTSFEKNCFSAWASTLNMGLINKVDMVCLSPVGYCV